MRFIVYGAGAVGGVVGGRMFEHGHDVALIARGAHAAAIRRDGLRIECPGGVSTQRVSVFEHPSELPMKSDDVVLLAMKSQHTGAAVETLAALAPPEMAVVSLQNGVDNERTLLRHFANVYAVCVICPATHLEPGVVQANSAPITGLLDIGRYCGDVDATTRAISATFNSSTFESLARPDIMRWKYSKLLMNLGNAAEALCGPESRSSDLVKAARQEGEKVLKAAGIDFASLEEDRARRGQRLQLAPIAGSERAGSSSWQSLQRGTGNIECDYLNGEIVLLGRTFGVATPINERLQFQANRLARLGLPPGSLKPAEIMA